MKKIVNVIWHFPYLGFLMALGYLIAGAVLCCTFILIPAGLGLFQYSKFLLAPFTRAMIDKKDLALINKEVPPTKPIWVTLKVITRIVYFIPGIFLVCFAFCQMLIEFVTILGIPCGIVYAKSLKVIFNPVNKICIPIEVADEIAKVKSANVVENFKKS